jgi:dCTP diphosphatase
LNDAIKDLQEQLRDFADARDWNQFHTPKNLAMALTGEAGELAALFQWLTPEEVPGRENLEDEIADVFIYLLRLCDRLDVDLVASARAKIARNDQRYPAKLSYGNARKYTELQEPG